ncbi:multi-sensor hybrid histidine kinase [hydrothermal vent metagenome]|uniref:histidine kinase n=1 Tax=hydrothermal vent metagenome TaxID=652676 RepID=A0A3B0X2Y1_9ZZZZ
MDTSSSNVNNDLNKKIRLEEIRLLYSGSPFSFSAAVIISLITYNVLFDHAVSLQNLRIWLLAILSVMFIRSIDCYLFSKQTTQQQQNTHWRIRFFIGTGIAGFCWGLLPWLGYSTEVEYFSFILVCLVGVVAGSLSTLSYRWETIALFLLPSLSSLTLKIITEGGNFFNATSFVLLVFIFFSMVAGKKLFDNTQQNIRLRLEAGTREQIMKLLHQKQALHLQNTPLAIIEFNVDLDIIEWNKAAENIFGYSRTEAINKNIMRLILSRDSSIEAEKLWGRLLNYEAVTGTIIENKKKSGTKIFCEWFITPLTDEKNKIVGIAAMALDISEKKKTEIAIIQSKEEAEKANQAKSDFLSSMSHELRTPLNAILGFTQLLRYEKTLNNKQQSHISEINKAGSLLLELVNQILDLARIEKGHLQLSMEKISLTNCCSEVHAMVTPLVEKNNLSLDVDMKINGYVVADYTRLKQIILNLLSNAIKYNVEHGSVSLKASQQKNGMVRISVIDTGKGISQKLLKEIFQPFNRLNAATNIEGTGIGLSISKQLVEMMNGHIGVNSTVNEGSEFWFELTGNINNDISIKNEDKTLSPDKISTAQNKSHYKILVAEDNPTNQALILSQLETLGYTADLAENGQEALNKMVNTDYQLLFTDCNMPLIDGYKLTKTIRERGNHELPIIALTADAFPEKRAECLKAGMNDHLTKPIDLHTLEKILKKYLT